MIWIKKDIYGNEQVWYSGDVMQRIVDEISKSCLRCPNQKLQYKCSDKCFSKVLSKIIESEE